MTHLVWRVTQRPEAPLAKAHVKGYTRSDGTYVADHDDARPSAKAKPAKAGGYDHPNVVGRATTSHDDPAQSHDLLYNGRHYSSTGKAGASLHDKTPVREFREMTNSDDEDSGHRVWMDNGGRVHADSKEEVAKLRKEHAAHRAKGGDQITRAPDIGAGAWRTGHKVRVSDNASPLHNQDGTVSGAGHADGYANVTYPNGKTHSVHSADLLPATGHKWPDAFGRQAKR